MKTIYNIRGHIVKNIFITKHGWFWKKVLIPIDFIIYVYERVKYHKFYKHLSKMGKAGSFAGEELRNIYLNMRKK